MSEDFDDTIRKVLDGDRSDTILRLLGEQMKGNPERIDQYLELMEMDEMLAGRLSLSGAGLGNGEQLGELEKTGSRAVRVSFTGVALMAAACASLLLAVSLLLKQEGGNRVSKNIVAVLIDSEDCVWGSGEEDLSFSFGSPFGEGEALQVSSGIARLAMKGNAGLALEGPAEVRLVSAQEVQVHYGRVSAFAPEEAIGFKLTTPDVEIVDLGTRFAAAVDKDGRTDVHVFEGEISVKGKGVEENELITEGQARRYDDGRGITIENDPSLFAEPPALEQLLAIAGSNDLDGKAKQREQQTSLQQAIQSSADLIAWQDFTNGQGVLDGSRGGIGFGGNPWMASRTFTRVIPRVASHSGMESAGGYLLVRGRDRSGPSMANRVRRQLDEALPNDFYFAIRARYRGLDEDDFFALWIDVHGREDGSHADVPTLGIREGRYYARMHREHAAVAGRPVDGAEFVIAGHYVWDEELAKARIALWLNPVVQGETIPQPDASSLGPEHKEGAPEFRFIGMRMGQYTEISDELLVYGFSVADTFIGAVEAVTK